MTTDYRPDKQGWVFSDFFEVQFESAIIALKKSGWKRNQLPGRYVVLSCYIKGNGLRGHLNGGPALVILDGSEHRAWASVDLHASVKTVVGGLL